MAMLVDLMDHPPLAVHRRVGFQCRRVDADLRPPQQLLLAGDLQHEREHLLMHNQRQSFANPRQTRMIGRLLGRFQKQEVPQRQAVRTPPPEANPPW